MKLKNLFAGVLIAAVSLLPSVSHAGFDPVRQDIDIFMTNPSIASERPNVLIVLDTSANWNSYFAIEKTALIAVVNGLSDQYNVGLAMNAGGSIEGSYLRFAVRQMTTANKSALASLVSVLDNSPATSFSGDKTNNPVPGLSMVEAYRYFKGDASYSATTSNASGTVNGHDARTDYSGNTVNTYITSLAGNAFTGTPATASTYVSPVVDGCQKNFVIYISNGKGPNQTGETTVAKNELSTASGSTATAISPLSPTGNETDSWFDEWAKYLANTGFTKSINGVNKTVNVNSYVVEVAPGTQSQDLQWTATLKSGASNGKGKYYSVSAFSPDPGAAIVSALNAIFSEIQAVNSVFASTTLPVSVNVRGTNLNQVYIGMFRPDASKAPRWFGNLKLYKLALESDDKTLFLADAAGLPAESSTTGFIKGDARSYWTGSSTFWDYRTAEQNGVGAQSDSPDGDLVEKGAAAQHLRTTYETSQSARKLYTCTTGGYANCDPCSISGSGSNKTCSGSSKLSDTPFATANTDVTSALLGLDTKSVSPLTAKVTKTVATLADRRNVSLSNTAGTSFSITGVSNGATARALTALSPFDPTKTLSITSLSALASVVGPYAVQSRSASGSSVTLVTNATDTNPCSGKSTVVVTGNHSTVNGTWDITGSATVSGGKSSVTFTVASGSAAPSAAGSFSCSNKSTTATATVSALPAGLANGSRVNISGAVPSAFNGDYPVVSVSGSTFTYTVGSVQSAATTAGTVKVYDTVNSASGTTYTAGSDFLRVRATTSAAHGFAAGNSIAVSGVTPSTYNGSYTVVTSPAVTSTTFAYNISGFAALGSLVDATAFGTAYSASAATTAVTITTSAAHGFANGALVAITGLGTCFDSTSTAISGASGSTFSYTTASACAPLASVPGGATVAGAAYSTTVTATLSNHGYSVGNALTIADGTTAAHNGNYAVATVPDANTFTYTNGAVGAIGPSGQYTVRLAANPLVYANATGHGFATNDSITIAGGNPTGYNGTYTITVIDANNFSYPTVGGGLGANTGTSVTAAKNTTTARATSVNHGFANGALVDITGATPSAFNGTNLSITYVDPNTFTYTLGSAQGDASGTIKAVSGSGSSSERDAIINWVRGANNAKTTGGESTTAADTVCRASVHGDVLHSRPAVINYNRYGGDNDVYIYYGANDGVFRGIKGGTTTDATDSSGLTPGQEAWGFVPKEGFDYLKRMRNNSPAIGSDFKRPYFLDGPIGVYSVDGNGDNKLQTSGSDYVYLYIGARRGGRYMYSLDVLDPKEPRYRWTINDSSSGFADLGETWSQPTVVTGVNGYTNPVLIFGGGYDAEVEDIEPCTITATTAAAYTAGVYTAGTVTYNKGATTFNSSSIGCTVSGGVSTTVSRSRGRAIYIADAVTGAKIWSASYRGSGADLEVDGMDFAIPSDVTVVKNLSGGNTNRAYVGDTGGNLWRIDFGDANKKNWKVTRLASISDLTTSTGGYKTGYRKFMAPPDVVAQPSDGQKAYDAVLMGSGDREHPFDNTIVNRFYMFKDRGDDSGPDSGTTTYWNDTDSNGVGDTLAETVRTTNRLINHTNTTATGDGYLYDATLDCVQNPTASGCATGTTAALETAKINAADGWFFTLGTGEKTIGRAVIINGVVYFNTNQPSQTADASCIANLGIARQYQVLVSNAGAARENETTAAGRSETHAGGGYLPDPVHVVVQVEDSQGVLKTVEGVISGTEVQTPTTGAVGQRTRRYWYKEID